MWCSKSNKQSENLNTCSGAGLQPRLGNWGPTPPGSQRRPGLRLQAWGPPGSPGSHRRPPWPPAVNNGDQCVCSRDRRGERRDARRGFTCTGGKLARKPGLGRAGGGATAEVMAMTCGAGVGIAMETGGGAIMGCWCWGMTGGGAMAMPRAGRLGTGGETN